MTGEEGTQTVNGHNFHHSMFCSHCGQDIREAEMKACSKKQSEVIAE